MQNPALRSHAGERFYFSLTSPSCAFLFFPKTVLEGYLRGPLYFFASSINFGLNSHPRIFVSFDSGLPVVGFLPRFSRINRCRYLIPLSHKGEFRLSKMYLANFR